MALPDIGVTLEPYQPIDAVSRRETSRIGALLVQPSPVAQVAGYACIKRLGPVGHDVHEVGFAAHTGSNVSTRARETKDSAASAAVRL